jgi:hypothetical protein
LIYPKDFKLFHHGGTETRRKSKTKIFFVKPKDFRLLIFGIPQRPDSFDLGLPQGPDSFDLGLPQRPESFDLGLPQRLESFDLGLPQKASGF